ncbi:MAG: ATP synthase F1 subunit gamma [Planctomycetota bacterium]|jgi:F-type H+-transporting ATPase subunit gamma
MAGTRLILERRRAVEDIGKVTHTMETVSAVRYQQYYKRWAGGGQFYDSLAQLAYLIVTAEQTIEHPLMLDNKSDCNAILVIGSDRGLCGAYNSNICHLAEVHINMARRFGKKLKIYARGRKVINYLSNRGIELEVTYDDFEELPTTDQIKAIADEFMADYAAGRIGRLGIVYTRFHSPASQRAQTLMVLPVAELIDDLTTRTTVIWPWELAFEDFLLSPSAEEIFDSLATMMVRSSLSACFLDAVVSEHLGRVMAMRSATDNADEMAQDLMREYNRARQGQITAELLEIISGKIT